MDTRPNIGKYKGLVSVTIIFIFAMISLLVGIVILISSIGNNDMILGVPAVYVGFLCVLNFAFLTLFASIAANLHLQTYLRKYYGEENINYHMQSLQKLSFIEAMLQQKCYSEQGSYVPNSYPEIFQNTEPQVVLQHEPITSQPQKQARYTNAFNDEQLEYQAQYKRPASSNRISKPLTKNEPKQKE